jgi:hypothetical protein
LGEFCDVIWRCLIVKDCEKVIRHVTFLL